MAQHSIVAAVSVAAACWMFRIVPGDGICSSRTYTLAIRLLLFLNGAHSFFAAALLSRAVFPVDRVTSRERVVLRRVLGQTQNNQIKIKCETIITLNGMIYFRFGCLRPRYSGKLFILPSNVRPPSRIVICIWWHRTSMWKTNGPTHTHTITVVASSRCSNRNTNSSL